MKAISHIFGTCYLIQLGGGYLFGLPVGFVADSIGATIGAGAAFLVGRTVSFYGWLVHISPVLRIIALGSKWRDKLKDLYLLLLFSLSNHEQIGRSFVISKLKDYPQFNAVAIAIRKSGFKVLSL